MDDEPAPEAGERKPANPRWLTRKSEGLFQFFNNHPTLKLVGLLWVGASSVLGPAYSCYTARVQERREGWMDPPKFAMTFPVGEMPGWAPITQPVCRITNVGPRPLSAVSLRFRIYAVELKDPCSVRRSAPYGLNPMAHADELRASESLTANLPTDRFRFVCENWSPATRVCQQCLIVVECQAQFHRVPGLDEFRRSRYAFAGPGCTSFEGVEGKFYYEGPFRREFKWRDDRDRRAYSCFIGGKDSPLDRQDDEVPPLEDLERELSKPK